MNEISGLQELHSMTYGSSSIKIAVLDGPVDMQHSCFNTKDGKLLPYEQAVGVTPSARGLAKSHGTAVASLIFGKPGSNVEGVAPGCSGVSIPIYVEDENGKFQSASQVDLARAIKIAVEKGANIINISGGQFSKTGDPDHFLKSAIDDCYKAGVLIVAAAGNNGCSCLHVPAADQQVLAVGSLDENGHPTPETNFGTAYQINGILAQGKNLTAAVPGGGTYQTSGGTSFATPVVSGIVGLLMSLQIKEGLTPDAYVIKSILEQTAIPCTEDGKTDCRRFLRGQLNLPGAIAAIRNNPGVLASGINYLQTRNMKTMKEHPAPDAHEPLQEITQIHEVLPSEHKDEAVLSNSGPGPIVPEPTVILEKRTEELAVQPSSSGIGEPVVTTDQMDTSEGLPPAEAEANKITISGAISPDVNINNLKTKKIAKMETNQEMEPKASDQNLEMAEAKILSSASQLIAPSGGVDPSDCGCGGDKEGPAAVYALGTIAYDFGSESHRDSFVQSMGGANPHDAAQMLEYLERNPWDAEELIWTLDIDLTPIYALYPSGSHAPVVYERIREFLKDQLSGNIQRISVPGMSKGKTTLLNGYQVANLFPRIRGMYSWTTEALTEASVKGAKGSSKVLAENVTNFLHRIYHQMRNLGVAPEERALNYAATNAFQVSGVFASALKENLELDDITATKSPICRPGSDCYDVILTFFNPKERLTQARKEFRLTIDVSDVVPVTVGPIRSWSTY